MHTRDSLRYGLGFVGALGPVEKHPQPEAGVTVETLEKTGNPWRDEFGRFAEEANAVFNVNAALPAEELEARAQTYERRSRVRIRRAEKQGATGLKEGFLHYAPKAMQSGAEPEEWKKLNQAVGKAEGVANTYMERVRVMGKPQSPEGEKQKAFWLANAAALRDMATILAKKRGKIEVPKPAAPAPAPEAEGQVVVKDATPDFITEAFESIDAVREGLGTETARRAKGYVVANAIQIGLLSRDEGNAILDRIGVEEIREQADIGVTAEATKE